MTKSEAKKCSQGYDGYQYAYEEKGFLFYQKEVDGKFYLIKLTPDDMISGNFVYMMQHNISRI